MAEGTLAPAFLQILYRTAHAPHIMTIPMKGWTAGAGIGDFDTWDSASTPAQDYIDDFLALFKAFFLPSTEFYAANIFTKADAETPAIQQAGYSFTVAGTSADTGGDKAVQITWVFSSLTGKLFKMVMLDAPNGDSFEAITLGDLTAPAIAFVNFVKDDATAFSCRQDAKPALFKRATVTLNAELQRQYHMN